MNLTYDERRNKIGCPGLDFETWVSITPFKPVILSDRTLSEAKGKGVEGPAFVLSVLRPKY
jgi:hypothetical protein